MLTSATFAAGLFIATSAWAAGPGEEEIWFGTGADSLAVDENNKVTSEGAKTKTAEVDRIPGEEDWEVRIVARLNGYAGSGPLYIEFYQTINGEEHIVYRYEESRYDGSRNLSITTVLEANHGFNKNKDYRVQIIQNNGKRDIVLARGKIKLIDTGRKPPEEAEEGGEGEGEEEGEEEAAKQERPSPGSKGEKAPKGKKYPNNVRRLRIERMMSKAELARRANLSVLTIDRVEKGYGCRMDSKRKILEALGLSLADRVRVFGEEE
jgi:ribosome-binding protein aMBF1 (putative translation factor)